MNSLLYDDQIWEQTEGVESLIAEAQQELDCSRAFARVVTNRYGSCYSLVSRPPKEALHPTKDLPDLPQALDRIEKALQGEEDIFIQGDFDVDGLSSAAIIYRGLKGVRDLPDPGKLKVGVGDRIRGHGLDKELSARLIRNNFDLLITTDCGVKDREEISHLRDYGVDVIVTDHHQPPEVLPPALAIVDPKRPSSCYPNPYLAGAGVAYKLIDGLYERLGSKEQVRSSLLQLVALGTIADLVPLLTNGVDENRQLVKLGLQEIQKEPIPGLVSLFNELGDRDWWKKPVETRHISYRLAPKLNSANRVGDPKVGFLLLATNDTPRADYLVKTLIDYDRDRSRVQQKVIRQAKEQLELEGFDPRSRGVVFVVGSKWNLGIIGLVSSKLCAEYDLPAVTVSRMGGRCRGSMRSVEGVSVVEGFDRCSQHLIQFGGHAMAGGFTAYARELDPLRDCLNKWSLEKPLAREQKVNSFEAELRPERASMNLVRELELLKPFGEGNHSPRFYMKNLDVINVRQVGKSQKHLKLTLASRDETFSCIGFGLGDSISRIQSANTLNPIFKLEENVWNGERSVQLNLEDFVA